MLLTQKLALGCSVLCALGAGACGSSASSTSGSASHRPASATAPVTSGGSAGSAGGASALSADANSAATGDIPDNQVFLVFRDSKSGFSIKYPEGWTQGRAGGNVTFQDKNNLVRVRITRRPAPTVASVTHELKGVKTTEPTLKLRSSTTVSVGGRPAIKTVYTTESAPNAVTGRRVLLVVDHYELSQGGKVAIVDLGTPKGVDNVDAYRMMINSFRWQ